MASSPIDIEFDESDDDTSKFIEPMDFNEPDEIERTIDLVSSFATLKTKNALCLVAQASVYKLESTMKELTTAQAFILAMFDALYNENFNTCWLLLAIEPEIVQLKSSYLEVWLREDFNFKDDVVSKVLTHLDTMDLDVPHKIVRIFAGLTERYGQYMGPSQRLENANNNEINAKLLLQASRDLEIPNISSSSPDELSMSKRRLGLPPNASVQDVRTHACMADREGYTLMHRFAESGQIQGVEELLSINVPYDLKGPAGTLPIHMAVECGQTQVLPILLRAGCNMSVPRDDGNTPAHLAAAVGNAETIGWLFDHGADITATNEKEQTPLHVCAASGFFDVVTTLLNLMAELRRRTGIRQGAISRGVGALDPRDAEGNTPLHLAARANNVEVVRILLDNNADYKLLNNEGHSPLTEALLWGANEAEKLLQEITLFDRGQHSR